jgi:hypothetical protein
MSVLSLQAQALSCRSIGRNFVHTSWGLSNAEHIKAFGNHLFGIQAGEGASSRKIGPRMMAHMLRDHT